MSKRYIVKIKGEFEETQMVIAQDEADAQEKAKKRLGEIINIKPTSNLEILTIKEFEDGQQHASGQG